MIKKDIFVDGTAILLTAMNLWSSITGHALHLLLDLLYNKKYLNEMYDVQCFLIIISTIKFIVYEIIFDVDAHVV